MVSTLLVRVVLGGFGLIEFQYLYCAAFVIAVEEGWGAAAVNSGQPLEREGVLTAITGLGEGWGPAGVRRCLWWGRLASDRPDDARRVIDWLERGAARLPCCWPRIAAAR
jgi:hypothetical protein